MKRGIRRGAILARWAGIALLCVALILSIYVTASVGAPWGRFSSALHHQDFVTRLRFDRTWFDALSRAVSDKSLPHEARVARAREAFGAFEAEMAAREAREREDEIQSLWRWFDEELDVQALLKLREGRGESADSRRVGEVMDYLDSFTAVKAKGKAAKLKPASVSPFFEAEYESRQGEERYAEFLSALKIMLDRDLQSGASFKDARDWYNQFFDEAAYQEALAQVRSEVGTADDDLVTYLADAVEAGEKPSQAVAQIVTGDEYACLKALQSLILSPDFDGSRRALQARMDQIAAQMSEAGTEAFMAQWSEDLVAEADDRALVGLVGGFWWLTARFLTLWVLGAALVIASLMAQRLLSLHMLKSLGEADAPGAEEPLLRVEHLCEYFRDGGSILKAVDDVSFTVKRGEVFGLVGESGCGKTTTGRTIIHLYDPTAGDVYFDGLRISSTLNGLPILSRALRRDARERITKLRERLPGASADDAARIREEIRGVRQKLSEDLIEAQDHALESEAQRQRSQHQYRERRRAEVTKTYEEEAGGLTGRALQRRRRQYRRDLRSAGRENLMIRMQMIFQDPIASIDPRMTVREIIAEGLRIRGIHDRAVIDRKVSEMLNLVGLVQEHADRYPHEFSGGQRQRIGIARAIALKPELIIADEPISALDVSIQAQVINLLNDLRRDMGLTILFIAHNLSVVKYFSDRIAVMYYGHIVELADSEELFKHPLHPYTRALLSAIPVPDPLYERQRVRLSYDPVRQHDYSVDLPEFREVAEGHWVRCNEAELEQYRRELEL